MAFDIVAGKIFDHLFWNLPINNNECSKISNRYKGEYDVVLVGSSRCDHHFVSKQLCDSLCNYYTDTCSLYNMGIDGMFLNSSLCAIESMINRYTPKLIILEAESKDFEDQASNIFKGVGSAKPFYNSDRVVRKYIDDMGWKNKIVLKLNFCRYADAMPIRILKTILQSKDNMMGYDPVFREMQITTNSTEKETKQELAICEYTRDNFMRVVNLCHDKNVPIVIVSSPRYYSRENTGLMREMCELNDIPFFDFNNLELYNSHPEWFGDDAHLNDTGAHVFTGMFFSELKSCLDTFNSKNVVCLN